MTKRPKSLNNSHIPQRVPRDSIDNSSHDHFQILRVDLRHKLIPPSFHVFKDRRTAVVTWT